MNNLVIYATSTFPNATFHCAYEDGFSRFWACRALNKAGFNTLVVNPADILTSHKDITLKNDARDSLKIAKAWIII